MFRLPFLYKTSNELLFKPLSTYRVKVQTDCVRHFRTSANNKRSTACESRPTSNDRKLEQSLTSLKQSIREQVNKYFTKCKNVKPKKKFL